MAQPAASANVSAPDELALAERFRRHRQASFLDDKLSYVLENLARLQRRASTIAHIHEAIQNTKHVFRKFWR